MIILITIFQVFALLERFCQEGEDDSNTLRRKLIGLERQETWDTIRIKSIWPENEEYSKFQVYLAQSISYYEKSLKVKRLKNPLILSSDYFCGPDWSLLTNKTLFADFGITVVFLSDPELKYAAMSYPCTAGASQPVTGHMKLNLAYISSYSDSQLIMIFTHELTHALGFTSKLFKHYIDPATNEPYQYSLLINTSLRDQPRTLFAGPNLIKKAKAAFSCPDLAGLELENQGGKGTETSHWERRVMFNEYMNPVVGNSPAVYSDLSLAVLADSGWYQVSYEYSESISWGFRKGCSFIYEKCFQDFRPVFEEFCEGAQKCSFDCRAVGECQTFSYEEVPEANQYFSNKTLGGDYLTDYCPVVKEEYFCNDFQEKHSENFWCIEGKFTKKGLSENTASCHEVKCLEASFLVISAAEEAICYEPGQIVKLGSADLSCPSFEKICKTQKNPLKLFISKAEVLGLIFFLIF